MSIIDSIKKIFRINNQKLLPKESNIKTNDRTESNKYSLEDIFDEYVYLYAKQEAYDKKIDAPYHDVSYHVTTRLFSDRNEPFSPQNAKNAEKLIKKLRKQKNKYECIGQYNGHGEILFHHVYSKHPRTEKINDESGEKLYLNCDRANIALLSGEILKELDTLKIPFKMKFLADEKENFASDDFMRNEKIVLYSENSEECEMMINAIEAVKSRKPELFSDDKTIPFMPNVNGYIGRIEQPQSNVISSPLGGYSSAGKDKTYNSMISRIMEDSVAMAISAITGPENRAIEKAIDSLSSLDIVYRDMVKQNFKSIFPLHCVKSGLQISYKEDARTDKNKTEYELYNCKPIHDFEDIDQVLWKVNSWEKVSNKVKTSFIKVTAGFDVNKIANNSAFKATFETLLNAANMRDYIGRISLTKDEDGEIKSVKGSSVIYDIDKINNIIKQYNEQEKINKHREEQQNQTFNRENFDGR